MKLVFMTCSIQLRDYQNECLEAVLGEYSAGISRQLISLPTGSGKTIVMAAIAKRLNKKTLILAHREELLTQAVDKFKLFWPGVDIGLCKAERNEINAQIVIGSVQSCCRPNRLAKLQEQGFELLMIDEAHHATADSYKNIINNLSFDCGTKHLLIGVSATVDREGLGNIFEKIVYSRSINTMIKSGFLSPIIGRKILTNLSLGKIRIQNGDFSTSELAEVVNTPERNAFIVEKYKEYAANRKGIAFCVNVEHCKDLADAFKSRGIASIAVWGDMPPDERKNALDNLKTGKIQVATSCGVLTEGFDEPTVDAILMARPTKSTILYTQSVGRGLRKHPSKENCLVLDFTDRHHTLDNVVALSSISEAVLLEEVKEEAEEQIEKETKIDNQPKLYINRNIDKEFDVLGVGKFIWVNIGAEWSLMDDDGKEIVMHPSENGFKAVLYNPDGTTCQIVNSPLPLEYCQGVCEDFARMNLKTSFAQVASWLVNARDEGATTGQRNYLQKQNAWRENMSKAQATFEIRKIVTAKNKQRRSLSDEPITYKQKYFLNRKGIKTDGMSKFQAMQTIAKLKKAS
jgi:superfamily II DNA or RNA helicase